MLARELTREGIFEALRSRRCYAVNGAPIVLDFRIDGHIMGETVELARGCSPRISVDVRGTDRVAEVIVVRDVGVLRTLNPDRPHDGLRWVQGSSVPTSDVIAYWNALSGAGVPLRLTATPAPGDWHVLILNWSPLGW